MVPWQLTPRFTAPGATVNQFNRLSHRDDIYFALFQPSDRPTWSGNLKRYKLGVSSTTGDDTEEANILDVNETIAVDSETGFFRSSARSFWTRLDSDGNATTEADGANVQQGGAASRIGANDMGNRKLYTYTGDSSTIPNAGIALSSGDHKLHEDNESITADMLGIDASLPTDDRALYRDELLKWTRGLDRLDIDTDSDRDEPRRHMGDPMHSSPVIVNYREAGSTNEEDDQSVIYVSTNEGLLHAINAEDGNELWAFSPSQLMRNHNLFFVNSLSDGLSRPYGMDGPMSVWRDETDNDFVVESGESVFLYGSMRRGGNNYYAFNITDPENPVLAWVIEGGPGGTEGFSELGQSWSNATKTQMLIDDTVRDVLVFGGGYDTNQDPDPTKDNNGNAVTMEHSEDSIGRGIFIVDAGTGEKTVVSDRPCLRSRNIHRF